MQLLCSYDWPGNVRQLENTVYRAIVLADTPHLQAYDFPAISGQHLPQAAMPAPVVPAVIVEHQAAMTQLDAGLEALADQPVKILDGAGHLRKLEDIERDLIEHAISVYAGHMSEVARRLGIGRSTLYRKVRDCGLEGMVKEAG
jgi:DNA-binding NtrC family response regulator